MLIGELSNKTGLSRDTIRFYEKQGLIIVGRKERRFNNYKEYSEETLNRLHTIKRIKGFGFTLNETSELLDLIEIQKASCSNVSQLISDKVILIDKKIEELKEIKKLMINMVTDCSSCETTQSDNENCPSLVVNLEKQVCQ